MPILIEKARSIGNKIIHAIRRKMEFLREKLGDLLGTHPIYRGLVYTDEENELISKTVEIMTEYFPEPPGQYLVNEDYESRCEAIEDYGMRLIEVYGLDDVEIVITDSEDAFAENEAFFTYGRAVFSEKKIYINANCLQSNDQMVLEHVVSTVIHELRHFLQYRVALMEKTYGVSYDRRHAWRVNFVHYIEAEYDMEGYMKQPIEFDARNFTNRVWQGAYSSDVK